MTIQIHIAQRVGGRRGGGGFRGAKELIFALGPPSR